ncbi:hypothetical protein HRbin36_02310 [bacterium HR36]|nr:hypothetical protein HRbin36_02310 [bacterium HR36]
MTNAKPKFRPLQELIRYFEEFRDKPVLRSHNELLDLLQALRRANQDRLVDLIIRAVAVAKQRLQLAKITIIGVVGQLNAGKSSVVASFLSPNGRERVPRGVADRYGTHRFVYWLPQHCAQDRTLQEFICDLLTKAHGVPPEMLSEDPNIASAQYVSGRDQPTKIPTPLIAFDAGLTVFGFLDCLDIQTADAPELRNRCKGAVGHNIRLNFVAQAARVCSAFLVVWERAQLRDRLLRELLTQLQHVMAEVPVYLLINKVRPEPGVIRSILEEDRDVQELKKQFRLQGIYLAMDFDIPGWKDYTPRGLVDTVANAAEQFPLFFTCEPSYYDKPQEIPSKYWLVDLFRQLKPGELQQQLEQSHVQEILQLVREGVQRIEEWMDRCAEKTKEAYKGLLEFCCRQFADERNEPRQVPNKRFFSALRKAIIRNGPWYVRWVGIPLEKVKQIWGQLRSLPPSKWSEVLPKEEYPTLLVKTGDELVGELRDMRWIPASYLEDLKPVVKEVIEKFEKFHRTQLQVDPQKLDEMAQDFWKGLSGWAMVKIAIKSALAIFGVVIGLAGAIVAIIDGGATLLSAFSFTSWLASHIPGLAALTVGVIGTGAAFAIFYQGLVEYNTLPALAALFYLFCDAFGLPRELPPGQRPTVWFGRGKNRKQFTLPPMQVPGLDKNKKLSLPDIGCWEWTEEGRKWREFVHEFNGRAS